MTYSGDMEASGGSFSGEWAIAPYLSFAWIYIEKLSSG
jgi:hypothetical protein